MESDKSDQLLTPEERQIQQICVEMRNLDLNDGNTNENGSDQHLHPTFAPAAEGDTDEQDETHPCPYCGAVVLGRELQVHTDGHLAAHYNQIHGDEDLQSPAVHNVRMLRTRRVQVPSSGKKPGNKPPMKKK